MKRCVSNLFPPTHRDLLRYAQRRGIHKAFDEWQYEGMAPFTFIDYEAREREFHVHAYHAFPIERTIVKTQSIFESQESRFGGGC